MSKIKFKLNGAEYATITQLIRDTEVNIIHHHFTALIDDLMMEVLEKTYSKGMILDQKSTIGLTSAQARAFMVYFSHIDLNALPYEQNLIRQMVAQINKELTDKNKLLTKSENLKISI